MRSAPRALLAALALTACVDHGAGAGDRAARLFDPDHVIEIDVALAPADWETVRTQTRSWVEVYGACLAGPFPSPFTWAPASVTIDGVRVERARLRKKGFLGSLDVDKPSLKLGFDDQDDARARFGVDGLTLDNAHQDPAYVRACLSYRTFAAAGLPAPRCNFARVRVNGADLGIYVHVEEVDRAFLARHFDDDGGNLYEGTFSDFRAGWTATFELETNRAASDRRDLEAVVDALERPDPELLDAVGAVVALDPLFTFWAVEVLVTHRDGFAGNANNFFAYHDPGGDKFHLIPWGADGTFLPGPDPFGTGIVSVAAGSLAPWRLYRLPAGRARYHATLRALLDRVWDEPALEADLDRMAALLAPIVDPDGRVGFAASIEDVRGSIRGRRAAILAELDAGPPGWSAPPRAAPCLERVGEVTGVLQTTWGTPVERAFAGGGGALAATIDGAALEVTAVGAAAGPDPGAPARARLVVVAALAGGDDALVALQVDRTRLVPGARIALDGIGASGLVYRRASATGALSVVGQIADGSLEVTAGATADDAPVAATFSGSLVRAPR